MAHFKRQKSRRIVRCTLCTPHRWFGNNKGPFKDRVAAQTAVAKQEAREAYVH
jgi:hypothetical protein